MLSDLSDIVANTYITHKKKKFFFQSLNTYVFMHWVILRICLDYILYEIQQQIIHKMD